MKKTKPSKPIMGRPKTPETIAALRWAKTLKADGTFHDYTPHSHDVRRAANAFRYLRRAKIMRIEVYERSTHVEVRRLK